MAKSYSDPIKSLSREKIREFIRHNYNNKDPEKLRVVCFPGAEQDGQEALEVIEIYDALNIPRENITGLEIDSERANRLRAANLGIEVIASSDITFFQQIDRNFDIISLDYTSNFNDPQRYALELISARKLLGKGGILATNYLAQRESKNSQRSLSRGHRLVEAGLNTMQIVSNSDLYDKMESLEDNIAKCRSSAIQEQVGGAFFWGEATLDPTIFANFTNFKDLDDLADIHQQRIGEGIDEKIASRCKFEALARTALFRAMMFTRFRNAIVNWPLYQQRLMLFNLTKPYFIEEHEAFAYTSNSGSPMLLDCYLADTCDERIRSDFFEMRNGTIHVLPNYKKAKRQKLKEKAKRAVTELAKKQYEKIIVEREDLGSSYIPKRRLTKKKAIDLLRQGRNPKDLASEFSGFSKMQLAALRAHITMGTYD